MAYKISELKMRLQEAGDADLDSMLKEFKEELFNLRFQEVTQRLENTKRIWFVRKAIARILTEKRRRELEAQGGAPKKRGRKRQRRA